MTTAKAATRLRVDSSRVIHYLNRGLERRGLTPLVLRGKLIQDPKSGRRRWDISADAVREFNASRKWNGI